MNPARMGFGLLRVLNDDIIEPGAGFPTHHHDNMEIVTIVLEGTLHHKDSTGGEGTINTGEIQGMSAGSGIYHSEFNASDKERVHLLQIWVETAGEVKAGYAQKSIKIKRNELVPVVGKGGLSINQQATFLLAELGRGVEVAHNIAQGHGAYVFIIDGSAQIANQTLKEADAAGVTDTTKFSIKAVDDCKVLVIDVPME